MSHVTHINESCHTHQWVISHTSMSHLTHINESCHTHPRVMPHWGKSLISSEKYFDSESHKSKIPCTYEKRSCGTHRNESRDTYRVAMISRPLHIQVSFAKEPYQRDCILQKRPVILRSLQIVATPMHVTHGNKSTPPCEWVMSQISMSHVAHTNESYHIEANSWFRWGISMQSRNRAKYLAHIKKGVVAHTGMSRVTHRNESRDT